jgi:hypothetical protein
MFVSARRPNRDRCNILREPGLTTDTHDNSTERAKDMAGTNGFDQARINKENVGHNSFRGLLA